jgi:GAF domain-containing protein
MSNRKKKRKQSAGLPEVRLAKPEGEQAIAETIHLAHQQALFSVITKIHQALDLDTILQATVTEVRQLLEADRVSIFQFATGHNSGEIVAEAVLPGFRSMLMAKVEDHCFGERYGRDYQQGRIWAVSNIHKAGLADCHLAILSQFQIVADLVVPLLEAEKLWGLLCIHQCDCSRQWQATEIEFATQIAVHLGIAIS